MSDKHLLRTDEIYEEMGREQNENESNSSFDDTEDNPDYIRDKFLENAG